MGVILAIAPDAASQIEALASAGPFTLSLLAAAVAAIGLWLWGKERHSLLRPPVLVPAVAVHRQRSPDILPPVRHQDRPRTPAPAASSSPLRAPPGPGTVTGASPGGGPAGLVSSTPRLPNFQP